LLNNEDKQLLILCINDPNMFCFICGTFMIKTKKLTITPIICQAYELYFGFKVNHQDKVWAHHCCCRSCSANSRNRLKRDEIQIFAVPMIWWEQKNHVSDCYFCVTKITGMSSRYKRKILYHNLPSAQRPIQHNKMHPSSKVFTRQ
jgi:hypothetical protein